MFHVEATLNLYALAGTAGVINAMVTLDEVTTIDTFKSPITLLSTSAVVLYTAPGVGVGNIKAVVFTNTSSTQVGAVKLFKGSSAIAATQISGTLTVPANGTYIFTGEIMQPYDSTGASVSGSSSTTAKNYAARVFAQQTWS